MSWLTGQHGAHTYICPEDRYVVKSNEYSSFLDGSRLDIQKSFTCPTCRKPLINMWGKWRAPKKRNDKAWNGIVNGDVWWDKKSLLRSHVYNSEYNNAHLTKRFLEQLAARS